ncbi:MAG: tetratricopeptide repeat protein, partial [Gallionellaceae bacterium]|nr:tetratricopeptide repeat protein [Gallionellaceae bacterium]
MQQVRHIKRKMQPLIHNIFIAFDRECRFGMVLSMTVIVSACASNVPKKETVQQVENRQTVNQLDHQPDKKPVITPIGVLTPELRADFNAALDFMKSGDYNKAIALLNQVAEQLPNNPVPYVNLALAYGKTGNLKLAEKNFQSALDLDPGNAVASNEYAILKRKAGKFFEARKIYERTLEKYPDFYIARKNLGILCDLYMRDYKCALQHYQIYSDAMSQDKVAKIWVADMQKKLGR